MVKISLLIKMKLIKIHKGIFSIYLRKGEEYHISDFTPDGIYIESMWGDYVGYYSLNFFFTDKTNSNNEIR